MALQTRPEMQQSPAASLPGTWKLAAGRAITLQPREEGTFKVAHGQMWVTYDGPHGGAANESGDHIVGVGERLRIRAGQKVVVESWNWQSPSYFSWDPLPIPARSTVSRWNVVVQPLADLRLALALGLGALGRLVTGVGAVAWEMVVGKGRHHAFDSRTCGAHGA